MDIEEMPKPRKIEKERVARFQTTDLSKISFSKKTTSGLPPILKKTTTDLAQKLSFQEPQSRPGPNGSVSNSTFYPDSSVIHAPQSARANPIDDSVPPLFIGFLTNEGSIGQIRSLFSS